MSKYFSNDSNIDTTHITPDEVSRAIPTPPKVEKSPAMTSEQFVTPTKIEEEVLKVAAQSAIVKETMDEINRVNPRKIEESFKTFKPAELFERLNQITFLMIEMNNRMTAIEAQMKSGVLYGDKSDKPLSPKEQFEQSNTNTNNEQMMTVAQVKEEIKRAQTEKKVPSIPTEDYIDKGVRLEEIFPEQSNEALQAAYESMAETEKEGAGNNSITPTKNGGMKGIVF